MRKLSTAIVVSLALIAAVAVPVTYAGKPNKNADPACIISGTTVTASGLPMDQVINFLVTDASGTTGWVLGFTDTGSWSVTVPNRTSATTYQFVSRTWGPNGSKYTVFSSCSA